MPDQATTEVATHGIAIGKALLWTSCTAGFAWTTYFAAPLLATSAWCLLAQGTIPDFSLKDFANVGGFAIFAFSMYRLHVSSIAQHREDRKADRDQIDRMVDHLAQNTQATRELNQTLKKQ